MSRATLKPIVSKLRESIIKGISGKLEKYGFDENGVLAKEKPLSEFDETIRTNLIALFEAKHIDTQEKYVDYIHDTSRTFMHILICFKLMEKRGIMDTVVSRIIDTDIYNEIMPDFIKVAPIAYDEFIDKYNVEISNLAEKGNNEEDIEYYRFLYLIQCMAKEMSTDVPLLFKDYEYNLIQPDFEDMKIVLQTMASIEEEEFLEDDFLGWIYQYWVDTAKEEIKRAKEEKELSYVNTLFEIIMSSLSDEQSEYGEFYTPRHVVKEIVDNTINEYLRRENSEIKDIKLLDPACGAGNFLVYAFGYIVDLYSKYYPEMSTERKIVDVLSNNIYGTDIQREPLQITAINLWMKAKSIAAEAKIKTLNLYNVNILMADSLYPWETEEEFRQMSFFEQFEEPKFTSENIGKLLSERQIVNHNSAVSFYKQKFSVIVMNPPYLGIRKMKEETANFLKTYYPKNYFNLFEAFIVRAFNLLENNGVCGFVGTDTFMNLDSYENLRVLLITKTRLIRIEQLGNVFDGPTVNAVVMIWVKNKNNKDHRVLCKSDSSQFKYESHILQEQFKVIKGYPIIPTLTEHIATIFKKNKTLVEYAEIKQGMISGNNKKYLRNKWEVPKELIGKRFFPYANGGGYAKFANDIYEYIDYEDNGRILKEDAKRKYGSASRTIKNVDYFFRPGITYSPIGGNNFSARRLPPNCIFSDKGPCIFSREIEEMYLLGFANSKVFNYFIKLLNPTIGFAIADIERVPFILPPVDFKEKIISLTKAIVETKEFVIGFDKSSDFFHETEIQYGFNKGNKSIKKAYEEYKYKYIDICNEIDCLQKELDENFYQLYGITENEQKVIEESITGRILVEEEICSVEKSCMNYLRNIVKEEIEKKPARLYTSEELASIIHNYIEESIENGYLVIEEIESILGRKIIEIIEIGAKIDGSSKKFSGDTGQDMNEPLIISKFLGGTGKQKKNIFWLTSQFLLEFDENKCYVMQNEIRRLTNEIYLPKLQRAKEKLQVGGYTGVEEKKLEKEVALYEECVKTLENWKVVE
ncbi:MAG: N-6 DNA methylase [Lachnospiraceae bacterium]|nr:N-6 DNA methylase [Lachnospiraceae bacterium]